MRTIVSLLALLVTVAACGRRAHDVSDAFRWETELQPGVTVHLRTATGRIEVTPIDGRSARFSGSTHWVGRKDPIHFAWRRDGDEVYVCALSSARGECDEGDHGFSGSDHSWLDMFSLFKRRSTNASATLRVALPSGVKVDAHALSGSISLVGATGGVSAHTLNGSIDIEHSAGPVEAKGTNGNIQVSLDSLGDEDEVTLESVNGNMTAVLPSSLEGDVQLATVNGSVRSDFPITTDGEMSNRHLRGQIGNSSRDIVLKTVNGNVSLLKAPGASRTEASSSSGGRRSKS